MPDDFESPIEEMFWDEWQRRGGDTALDLEYQYRIKVEGERFRLDFARVPSRVAVELDGFEWHRESEQFTRDRRRHRKLERNGWRVIRFSGSEIHQDVESCYRELDNFIDYVGQPRYVPFFRIPRFDVDIPASTKSLLQSDLVLLVAFFAVLFSATWVIGQCRSSNVRLDGVVSSRASSENVSSTSKLSVYTNNKYAIVSKAASVYMRPDTASDVVRQLEKGEDISLAGHYRWEATGDEWYYLHLGGWIQDDVILQKPDGLPSHIVPAASVDQPTDIPTPTSSAGRAKRKK